MVSKNSRQLVAYIKFLWGGFAPRAPPVWQTTIRAIALARATATPTPQTAQSPEYRRVDFSTEISVRSPIVTLGTSFSLKVGFSKSHLVLGVTGSERILDERK